jgi:hypothetical protein
MPAVKIEFSDGRKAYLIPMRGEVMSTVAAGYVEKEAKNGFTSSASSIPDHESSFFEGFRADLRHKVATYFNDDEIKSLCFDLGIEYENLAGETREAKARELVTYCERTSQVSQLANRCRELRPSVDWRVPEHLPEPESLAAPTQEKNQAWWDKLPVQAGGDVIVGQVGAGARGVAIGKNITQSVYDMLGAPTPGDKQIIDQSMASVMTALQQMQGQLDANTAKMAEFQLKLLHGELAKTEEDEKPSASTITQVGDWLVDSVPQIGQVLASLFATPAVGKVVGKAGEVAVVWVKQRFGK